MKIAHGSLSLMLHEQRAGAGDALLLLHELGASSAQWADAAPEWQGRVFALDFAGHGASDRRPGGAYTAELLAADADAALAAVGQCWIAGAGLGAYVALLLAGARPDRVSAALLLPGAGLDGGGARPDFARPPALVPSLDRLDGCDPMVATCAVDVRPPEYARAFGLAARRLVLAEDGAPRPPWWESLRSLESVQSVAARWREAFAGLRAGER